MADLAMLLAWAAIGLVLVANTPLATDEAGHRVWGWRQWLVLGINASGLVLWAAFASRDIFLRRSPDQVPEAAGIDLSTAAIEARLREAEEKILHEIGARTTWSLDSGTGNPAVHVKITDGRFSAEGDLRNSALWSTEAIGLKLLGIWDAALRAESHRLLDQGPRPEAPARP